VKTGFPIRQENVYSILDKWNRKGVAEVSMLLIDSDSSSSGARFERRQIDASSTYSGRYKSDAVNPTSLSLFLVGTKLYSLPWYQWVLTCDAITTVTVSCCFPESSNYGFRILRRSVVINIVRY